MSRYYAYERPGLYRSRRGILFGVCKGLAEYFDLSVFWTRMVVVALFIFTGFWPIGALYILAALLMKPSPVFQY
ncbi:MAG: PspC domain-containing protein [bacterium]|nr:PspC domain-containing protein [bacterium]